jgi:tRNA (guanosine-2'-O-)-methyltransferase
MTSERFQKIKAVLNKRQPDLTVIVDNVNKPHNIAAIFRSCDAVGIPDLHGFSSHEKIVGVNLKSASGSNNWVKLQVHDSITSNWHSCQLETRAGYKSLCLQTAPLTFRQECL